MNLKFASSLLLGSSIATTAHAEYVSSATALPPMTTTVCPKMTPLDGDHYHSDQVCDRAMFNSYKIQLGRHMRYMNFKEQGGIPTVPNRKTVVCPLEPQDMSQDYGMPVQKGLDTVWLVENTASTPIVVAWVDPETGVEASARNSKIIPAVADPDAILKPGEWFSVHTYEGDTFLAREFNPKTGSVGNVLMQHRVGLIPVGANADNLECPDEDIEPMLNNETAPEFCRTPAVDVHPCNTMDIGFRNVAGCPLHAYYVTHSPDTEGMCGEQFKFHLGVEKAGLPDYLHDWVSNTKYESTYMGHSFSFRLASNPSVLVETVTLEPTRVGDCPGTGVAVPVGVTGNTIAQTISYNIRDLTNSTASMFQNGTSSDSIRAPLPPPLRQNLYFGMNTF